jgi:ceramidase
MAYVDLYCERLAPGLLAEPVNAASNVAFFVAAWVLWRQARRDGSCPGDVSALIALMVAIGVGSGLFHTFAETWAMVLDVVPILLFQLAFLWIYSRRVIGWPAWSATALVAGFLLASLYAREFPHLLNGSLTYALAITAILALGCYHWLAEKPARFMLIAAAGVFVVSLFFRTIDDAVCPQFPLGTHFLWHLLDAVVLYLCGRTLLASHGNAFAGRSTAYTGLTAAL